MIRWLCLYLLLALTTLNVVDCNQMPDFVQNHPELGKVYNDLWKNIRKHPMTQDENFYEFLNRITKGKIFNISLDAHKLLEKEGYHPTPLDKDIIPEFNCIVDNKPKRKARNVHELTPFDVDIIAAFGDSLTAAFGAKAYTPIDLFIEYHGVSWSIGGDKDIQSVITLPNIIKEYNPDLVGFATGISPPLIAIPNENLDVAVSGNTAYGLMDQAKRFIKKMLINPKYDFFDSWKVLTLFIGGNDLCSCCRWWKNYKEKYAPKNFIKEVKATLDYLHERVPKLFVNLVTPPNVTILQDLASPWCDFTHLLECKCGSVYGKKAREFTSEVLKQYDEEYSQLIDSGRYDTRDDFTVVLQPFFDHTIIPRKSDGSVDRTFFAPDCFHFSGKAHAASALALWNSMLEPVGNKTRTWKPHEKFHCPTDEHPYFYTRLNSGNITSSFVAMETQTNVQDQEGEDATSRKSDGIHIESHVNRHYFLNFNPLTLFVAFCMVAAFSYYLTTYLAGNQKSKLSISENKQNLAGQDGFFSNEVKQLR